MSIGPSVTSFSEISIEILTFSFWKMRLKVSAKWQPFCLGLYWFTTLVYLLQQRENTNSFVRHLYYTHIEE